jgi:hypothetical protein
LILPTLKTRRTRRVNLLSRPHRPARSGEWTAAKAVTFIVTLAAHGSVTLAARQVGMSRKSTYALKARDPAFAAAWAAAMKAGAMKLNQGDKVEEVEGAGVSARHGNTPPSRLDRGRDFGTLLTQLRESQQLAPPSLAQ